MNKAASPWYVQTWEFEVRQQYGLGLPCGKILPLPPLVKGGQHCLPGPCFAGSGFGEQELVDWSLRVGEVVALDADVLAKRADETIDLYRFGYNIQGALTPLRSLAVQWHPDHQPFYYKAQVFPTVATPCMEQDLSFLASYLDTTDFIDFATMGATCAQFSSCVKTKSERLARTLKPWKRRTLRDTFDTFLKEEEAVSSKVQLKLRSLLTAEQEQLSEEEKVVLPTLDF